MNLQQDNLSKKVFIFKLYSSKTHWSSSSQYALSIQTRQIFIIKNLLSTILNSNIQGSFHKRRKIIQNKQHQKNSTEYKNLHDLNIIQQKIQHKSSKKMSDQSIFLDQNTYLKKTFTIDQLLKISQKTDSKTIAKNFLSNKKDLNQLKEVIAHQIDKVIDIVPPKHKLIIKQKFKCYSTDKKSKNGKISCSVKDQSSSSHTELENEVIDFFDMRENGIVYND